MYRLTARMLQRLQRDLVKYHDLFAGGRCSGWELEELIVDAIKSDSTVHHHVLWNEGGHDTKADIVVKTNEGSHPIQIKSGKVVRQERLELSGYRLGTHKGSFPAITKYLKSKLANFIAVSYKKIDDDDGRQHIYQVSYINAKILKEMSEEAWKAVGAQYHQVNSKGVLFSVRPSMSWQIWWCVPLKHVTLEKPFIIK